MNAREGTFLMMNFSLNCHGKLVDLSTPTIMGVINLTPDSFFESSSFTTEKSLLEHVEFLLKNGAKIIDLGGQSSRPGAELVSSEEEWGRIQNAITIILKEFPDTILSIDTFYSTVAQKAADHGTIIYNDISGGSIDDQNFNIMAKLKLPYVLMHIQGTPNTMQIDPQYKNVVREVWDFFDEKVAQLKALGVTQIILDPGFGFGKTVEQNYSLLKNMTAFHNFRLPVLAGLSRKSMINKVLKINATKALNGTTVLNTIAVMNGASILRVHDVIEAKEVITLVEQYRKVE